MIAKLKRIWRDFLRGYSDRDMDWAKAYVGAKLSLRMTYVSNEKPDVSGFAWVNWVENGDGTYTVTGQIKSEPGAIIPVTLSQLRAVDVITAEAVERDYHRSMQMLREAQ